MKAYLSSAQAEDLGLMGDPDVVLTDPPAWKPTILPMTLYRCERLARHLNGQVDVHYEGPAG